MSCLGQGLGASGRNLVFPTRELSKHPKLSIERGAQTPPYSYGPLQDSCMQTGVSYLLPSRQGASPVTQVTYPRPTWFQRSSPHSPAFSTAERQVLIVLSTRNCRRGLITRTCSGTCISKISECYRYFGQSVRLLSGQWQARSIHQMNLAGC